MSTLYRLEIYPNIHNLNAQTTREQELINWISKYLNISLTQIFEVKIFLIESAKPIAHFNKYAEEVFTDSVV